MLLNTHSFRRRSDIDRLEHSSGEGEKNQGPVAFPDERTTPCRQP
jgi:hypothetical protein